MISMLLSLWDDFRNWVTVDWNDTTFAIVISVLGVCGLLCFVSFVKGNFNKGKKIKWGQLVLALVLFVILGVISYARYA